LLRVVVFVQPAVESSSSICERPETADISTSPSEVPFTVALTDSSSVATHSRASVPESMHSTSALASRSVSVASASVDEPPNVALRPMNFYSRRVSSQLPKAVVRSKRSVKRPNRFD